MRVWSWWRGQCRRVWAREAFAAGVLFVAAAVTGMVYQASWGGHPQFWQNTTFTQGLMWVCGHGYVNPMVPDVPGLAAFLDSGTDCFDCGAIPEGVRVLPADVSGMTFEEVDAYHPQAQFPGFLAWQRYHLYLVWAVALCWWVFGVCWSSLTPLAGVLYGASVASAYGVFRAGMGRRLAVAAALLFMVSPLHLEMLPHLRDYSKAPFLVCALMLLAWLVRRGRGWRVTLGLAALGGLAALYLAVTHRDLPVVEVAEITPLMNYAYVRVRGEVGARGGGAAGGVGGGGGDGFPHGYGHCGAGVCGGAAGVSAGGVSGDVAHAGAGGAGVCGGVLRGGVAGYPGGAGRGGAFRARDAAGLPAVLQRAAWGGHAAVRAGRAL